MSVTIRQIAELSGVSRGTVDRVINRRGKVNPKTEALVQRVAKELGYSPNMAGKALAVRKKPPVLGVVVPSEGNPFFDDVLRGVRAAERELSDYGVRVLTGTMKGYSVEKQLSLIEGLEPQINALILTPISDPRIAARIDGLTERGVPVVTLNTDIENCRRLCYVGSNYVKGGETAGGLLGLIKGGSSRVGIVTGSVKVLGHNQRLEGFHNVIRAKYPGIRVVDFAETNDDDFIAFDATRTMLASHPEIDAIFIAAAGAYGVCRAVMAMGLEETVTILSFDKPPSTVEMLRRGLIKATICQQPFSQGYKAVQCAFSYLISGAVPEAEKLMIKNEIRIEENL